MTGQWQEVCLGMLETRDRHETFSEWVLVLQDSSSASMQSAIAEAMLESLAALVADGCLSVHHLRAMNTHTMYAVLDALCFTRSKLAISLRRLIWQSICQ